MMPITPSGGLIYINSLPEDNAGFELLSEKMKERVQKGLSILKAQSAPQPQSFQAPPQATPAPVAAPAPAPAPIPDIDDEIPF
jgi:single-stranded DNA-binding protein